MYFLELMSEGGTEELEVSSSSNMVSVEFGRSTTKLLLPNIFLRILLATNSGHMTFKNE
jgi:hypothetical protein